MKRVELILKGGVFMCAWLHDETDVKQTIRKFRRVAAAKGLPYTITLTIVPDADHKRKTNRNNHLSEALSQLS